MVTDVIDLEPHPDAWIDTIRANLDNQNMTDEMFRNFVRYSLPAPSERYIEITKRGES
jgi:hypothetical protein